MFEVVNSIISTGSVLVLLGFLAWGLLFLGSLAFVIVAVSKRAGAKGGRTQDPAWEAGAACMADEQARMAQEQARLANEQAMRDHMQAAAQHQQFVDQVNQQMFQQQMDQVAWQSVTPMDQGGFLPNNMGMF